MSVVDELEKLDSLRASGAINEQEYIRAKALVLDGQASTVAAPGEPNILKRFTRSSRDRWLGGVCGGLGEQTPVPSWAWRIGFCLMLFSFGVGLLPYILLWIFVPSDDMLH
jgi:phage shock protein PspC (stress-responsive transcriptional regulator)